MSPKLETELSPLPFPENKQFMFSGIDSPIATVLCWGGPLPVAGLKGFDLFRLDKTPAPQWVKLNKELLPLEGQFFDTAHKSLPQLEKDPFAPLLEPGRHARRDPLWFSSFLDMLRAFRHPILARSFPPPAAALPLQPYCLIGVYISGERNGANELADKPAWDDLTNNFRDSVIQWALREIERRGLVQKLRPNPDNVDFATLMRHVTVEGDCGQLGDGTQGNTAPAGTVAEGSDQLRSSIVLNGRWLLDLPREIIVALLLHELYHALEFFRGVATPVMRNGDIIDLATYSVQQETNAYSAIWDLIAAGDLVLSDTQRCSEIADAIRAIVGEFEELADRAVAADVGLTAAQQAAVVALRRSIRELLLKYRTFLQGLPAGEDPWRFRNAAGNEEGLLDVVNRLFDGPFRAP